MSAPASSSPILNTSLSTRLNHTPSEHPARPTGFSTRNKAALSISTNTAHQIPINNFAPHAHLSFSNSVSSSTSTSNSQFHSHSHSQSHPLPQSLQSYSHSHSQSQPQSSLVDRHLQLGANPQQLHHPHIHSPRPLAPRSVSESQHNLISPPPSAFSLSSPPTNSFLPAQTQPSSETHHPSLSGPHDHSNLFSSPANPNSSPDGTTASDQPNQAQQLNSSNKSPSTNCTSQEVPHPSVGPNVAGRIGVGGNVMVDPHNGTNVAQKGTVGAGAFVYKVYNMLLDPSFQHLISFNPNGQSFTVTNVQDFSKTVLPKHFKHNNFSSFVRQLNMYGFHKVNKTPRGQRGNDNSASWEFVHSKFRRGRPDLLEQIRRKTLDQEPGSQPVRKEHPPLFGHPQCSPTASRFSLDAGTFSANVHRPPPIQLVHTPNGAFFSHVSQLSQSEFQPPLSAKGSIGQLPGPPFAFSDIIGPPLGPSLLENGCQSMEMGPSGEQSSSDQTTTVPLYGQPPSCPLPRNSTHPIGPSPPAYPHSSSTPLTPLSAGPPLPSPMAFTLDAKAFAAEPMETLAAMRGEMMGRFQGVDNSYEALYRELHETRRRQDVLTELVEQMYKTLQTIPSANVGYGFPARELVPRSVVDMTPIFRITEHNHGHPSEMIVDRSAPQPVSLNNSPSVSEFSRPLQPPPSSGPYRQVSVDSSAFGAFRSLTLASYPSSPGELAAEQPGQSPTSSQSAGRAGVVAGPQHPTVGMDDGARLLLPNGAHGRTELSTGSVSPRTALSAALKTPLPPSPAPFGHPQGTVGTQEGTRQADQDFRLMMEQHYMRTDPLVMGQVEACEEGDGSGFFDQMGIKADCLKETTCDSFGATDEMMFGGGNEPCGISGSGNGVGGSAGVSTGIVAGGGKGKKRPASGSMDLSVTQMANNRRNS